MKNKVPENPSKNRNEDFNFLTLISSLLVTLYLTANIMAVKIITVGPFSLFDAGTLTFPFAYMLGDVLSEIWGYKVAKKVIFLTFFCNVLLVLFTYIGIFLPYPEYMAETQHSYRHIFNYVPRIVVASLISFLLGELSNAKIMVVLRDRQKDGRFLWIRTILSSVVGYTFDTVFFVLIAFFNTAPAKDLLYMIFAQFIAKLLLEALAGTPLAYALIFSLKKRMKIERA